MRWALLREVICVLSTQQLCHLYIADQKIDSIYLKRIIESQNSIVSWYGVTSLEISRRYKCDIQTLLLSAVCIIVQKLIKVVTNCRASSTHEGACNKEIWSLVASLNLTPDKLFGDEATTSIFLDIWLEYSMPFSLMVPLTWLDLLSNVA